MKNIDHLYMLTLRYSLLFTCSIVISGVWLFALHMTPEQHSYTKSLESVLEVVVPHLFSVSILAFVLLHFLLFVREVLSSTIIKLSLLTSLLLLSLSSIDLLHMMDLSYLLYLKMALLAIFVTTLSKIGYTIAKSL